MLDFDIHYSAEQEAFRQVIREWLDVFTPQGVSLPADGRPLEPEVQEAVRAFRRRLGAQGWLAPSWPRAIGGGGLTEQLEIVLQEELRRLTLPPIGDNTRWIPAVMVWGTEEQKQKWVIPALRGETITWQAFNEPHGGTDLANVKTTATKQGAEWVIEGEKAWITGQFDPDYMWILAKTDEMRPSHFNLGVFMINANLPGISIESRRLLTGSERTITFEKVRIPDDSLVGDPYQGWEIVQTILEGERGGFGFQKAEDGTIKSVLQFLEHERNQQLNDPNTYKQ